MILKIFNEIYESFKTEFFAAQLYSSVCRKLADRRALNLPDLVMGRGEIIATNNLQRLLIAGRRTIHAWISLVAFAPDGK